MDYPLIGVFFGVMYGPFWLLDEGGGGGRPTVWLGALQEGVESAPRYLSMTNDPNASVQRRRSPMSCLMATWRLAVVDTDGC